MIFTKIGTRKNVKSAIVRPNFKKDNRTKTENYRAVSLFNIFSKIYERYAYENLTSLEIVTLLKTYCH